MPNVGDPLQNAFRAELQIIITAAGIPWPLKKLENGEENPDASVSWIDLDYFGGDEGLGSFGSPGNNLWDETGQVIIRIATPLGGGTLDIKTYARQIRTALRARASTPFLTSEGRQVWVTKVAPLGGHQGDGVNGALWVESVALSYETTNLG